ncbi:hypothetical protein PHPALM_8879 [Phytophthora palmivora]|uniref:Uncharacterized protein n=1 Tax=Phytophthora palmivora TaxID=4796 RepID=A0A2P4Y954_9STRA|nr:hypothetical protein PHPALM_8879 [Phytophthora palmivora]
MYRWGGISKEVVTDKYILTEIDAIVQRVKNDTLLDVDRLFSREFRLDMKETDVNDRVLKYFVSCNQLIEEHGLVACFDGEHGVKEKSACNDDCKLHDLTLEKALEQDRDFVRRKRARYDEQFSKPEKVSKQQHRSDSSDQKGRGQGGAVYQKLGHIDRGNRVMRSEATHTLDRERAGAPNNGCLKCGGPHYVAACPTATPDEKKKLPKKFHTSRHEKSDETN